MGIDVYEAIIGCYLSLQFMITLVVLLLATRTIYETWIINGKQLAKSDLLRLWGDTILKMRGIYGSLIVHVFDIFTDMLVIDQWFEAESGSEDIPHIDSNLMAWSALGVFIFHKIVSAFAVYISNQRDWRQGVLQLFDLLLFVEIYRTHKSLSESIMSNTILYIAQPLRSPSRSIVMSVSNRGDKMKNNVNVEPDEQSLDQSNTTPMESRSNENSTHSQFKLKINRDATNPTLLFVYLRCLEAIFESTPQSILQLVYVLRTRKFGGLFAVSIIQSILSLTNAMLKSDNAYMTHDKWKRTKQRFPPTFAFLKHGFFRLFEISSRVATLALFWATVGGEAFTVLLCFEMTFPVGYMIYLYRQGLHSWTEFFLSLYIFVVLPPEWIFESRQLYDGIVAIMFVPLAAAYHSLPEACSNLNDMIETLVDILNEEKMGESAMYCMCCCLIPSVVMVVIVVLYAISIVVVCAVGFVLAFIFSIVSGVTIIVLLIMPPVFQRECYIYTNMRMWVSFIETMIIIFYGTYLHLNSSFIFESDYSITIFICELLFFVLYLCLYTFLMPDIRLPDNINIRSQEGYSYLGNTVELNRIWKAFEAKMINHVTNELNGGCDECDDRLIHLRRQIRELRSHVREYQEQMQKKKENETTYAQRLQIIEERYKDLENGEDDEKERETKREKKRKEINDTTIRYEDESKEIDKKLKEKISTCTEAGQECSKLATKLRSQIDGIRIATTNRRLKNKDVRTFVTDSVDDLWSNKCIKYAYQNEQWQTVEWLKARGASEHE